jgi:hypothetical protein
VKLAYMIICHKNPEQVVDLIRLIGNAGDYVLVQCNARSGRAYEVQWKKAAAGLSQLKSCSRHLVT